MAGRKMPAHLKTGWKYERIDLRPYSKFEDICYDAKITAHLGVAFVGLTNSHNYIRQWSMQGGVPRAVLVELRRVLIEDYKKLPDDYLPIPKGGELEPEERLPIEIQEKLEFRSVEHREHYRKKIERIKTLEGQKAELQVTLKKYQDIHKEDARLNKEYEAAITELNDKVRRFEEEDALVTGSISMTARAYVRKVEQLLNDARAEIAELKKQPLTQIAEVTALLTLRVNGVAHEYELDPTPQLKEVLATEAGNLNGSLALAMKHS